MASFVKRIPCLCLFFCLQLKSQINNFNDSITRILDGIAADTQKVNVLITLSHDKLYSSPKESLVYAEEARRISEKKSFTKGLTLALNAVANVYEELGKKEPAMEYYNKALNLARQNHYLKMEGDITSNMGVLHAKQGDYQTCLKYFLDALAIWEKLEDNGSIAMQLGNIGALHQLMAQFDEALKYQRRSLQLAYTVADSVKVAAAMNDIGLLFLNKKMHDSAEIYLRKSISLATRHDDGRTLANARGNLADVYESSGDYKKAIEYVRPGASIVQNPYALSNAYEHMGIIFSKWKRLDSAEFFLQKAISLADSIKALFLLQEAYGSLATVYRQAGRFDKAVDYVYKYANMKDTILNQERMKEMSELSKKYETEKQEVEIARLNAEKEKDKVFKAALSGGLLLLLTLAIVLLRGYRQKQKNNRELERKNRLIGHQKKMVEEQKHLVEEKQKEILDSINYARRIQRAHLPTEKYVDRNLRKLRG